MEANIPVNHYLACQVHQMHRVNGGLALASAARHGAYALSKAVAPTSPKVWLVFFVHTGGGSEDQRGESVHQLCQARSTHCLALEHTR